ncbi:Zinc carboxypeptidase [Robiginitalea myxolifaciens]|uniref:Zinc carboxypeptidase n=1 Tax=Robiginitalea myxolifaciens TaxID=400055 RepID=A0A1I6GWG7_9FLAO|nr:M14 family zinc carboxypeptidase [Robiginitalea myxolifaciens]SFR46421.1 Zinc carboxypeptidase [Robiginitalea myxolifaciens]
MTREAFNDFRLPDLDGRYLPPQTLKEALNALNLAGDLRQIGSSVSGQSISFLELGTGPIRVLLWSQMHGNESTTTRALLDTIKYVREEKPVILKKLTLGIVPMLNPDGAFAYTRENANGIDLNRDAVDQTQPESQALSQIYQSFAPQFCFNLHDQRTIYNVGGSRKPATLSFLAPAFNEERSAGGNRSQAMQLIAAIHNELSEALPGAIGLYDDSFNPNCVGDSFQKKGSATLLFEAGHFPGDYHRHTTRYFVFCALVAALESLSGGSHQKYSTEQYRAIPENTKDFVDILIHNPSVLGYAGDEDPIAIQYAEELKADAISWAPQWADPALSTATYGHRELDAKNPDDRIYIENKPDLLSLLQRH